MTFAFRRWPTFALLAALVLGWLASEATDYQQPFAVRFEKEGITLVLNGRELKGAMEIGKIRSVRVRTSETFEHFGGGSVTILVPGSAPFEAPLPSRWRFTGVGRPPPVGDWWVDRSHEPEDIQTVELNLEPPFEIVAELPGRVLQAFRLNFEGQPNVEIGIRAGLLNNDFYIARPGGGFDYNWQIGGPPLLDLRRSFGPLAKGFFLAAALALAACAIASLQPGASRGAPWITPGRARLAAWVLVGARFGFSCWIAWTIFGGLPTFQDDLCYYLRAKWILAGAFDLPVPPDGEQLQIPFTAYIGGRWLTPYPLNWSLLIAIGMAVGVPWIVSPICGAIGVWALFRFGRHLAGDRVGLLAAVLLATSPFCLVFSGSLMSHAATSMLLGLFALGFVRAWPEDGAPRLGLLVAAGAALGFAFGIRPLTAAAVGIPTLLLGLWEWKRRGFSAKAFGALVVFALAVVLGMVPTFIDNAIVTGKPLTFAYLYRGSLPSLAERLPLGTFWTDKSMAQLPYLMSGWGWPWLRGTWWICLPFGFAFVPFLLRRANRYDWFALGLFFSVVAAHYTYNHGTIHGFGPRIYVDTLFALFFLVARGLQCLAQAPSLRSRGLVGPWSRRLAAAVALALPLSTAVTIQARLIGYQGYNEVDARFLKQFAALEVPRGLFLLQRDALPKWIRAAPLLPMDPVSSPYVFAELRADNEAVVARYGKDRPIFVVTEQGIVPYDPAKLPP